MAEAESSEDLLRISSRARDIHLIIKDIFASNKVDLPKRQYIYVGGEEDTAHDSDQLTISFAGLELKTTTTSTSMYTGGCYASFVATYIIEIVRCTPQATNKGKYADLAPAADKLDEYGSSRAIDSWLLVRVGQAIGSLPDNIGGNSFKLTAEKESGGVQAIRLTVDVMV